MLRATRPYTEPDAETDSYSDSHAETDRIVLPERTDEVWHGYLPDARPGAGGHAGV